MLCSHVKWFVELLELVQWNSAAGENDLNEGLSPALKGLTSVAQASALS
jgi:hypothetical protein